MDLKKKWCVDDFDKDGTKENYSLAGTGTRGAEGATDGALNARNEAGTWAWAAYAQHMPKKTIKISKAKQYTTTSGLTGSLVTATAPNVTKKKKCDSDGKTYAFTFKNSSGAFSSWVLYAAAACRGRTAGRHGAEDPQHRAPGEDHRVLTGGNAFGTTGPLPR